METSNSETIPCSQEPVPATEPMDTEKGGVASGPSTQTVSVAPALATIPEDSVVVSKNSGPDPVCTATEPEAGKRAAPDGEPAGPKRPREERALAASEAQAAGVAGVKVEPEPEGQGVIEDIELLAEGVLRVTFLLCWGNGVVPRVKEVVFLVPGAWLRGLIRHDGSHVVALPMDCGVRMEVQKELLLAYLESDRPALLDLIKNLMKPSANPQDINDLDHSIDRMAKAGRVPADAAKADHEEKVKKLRALRKENPDEFMRHFFAVYNSLICTEIAPEGAKWAPKRTSRADVHLTLVIDHFC